MKLFLALLILVSSYIYMLLHTTNLVLGQTQRLGQTYQYVASHTEYHDEQLTTGR